MASHESNFLHHYQNLLFKDDGSDPFMACSIRRKCLAQLFKASVALSDDKNTCLLLNQKLKEYAHLVDDKKEVNNYAEPISSLISNCLNECQQWSSRLKDAKKILQENVPPLECSQSYSCRNYETTEQNIRLLSTIPNETRCTWPDRRELEQTRMTNKTEEKEQIKGFQLPPSANLSNPLPPSAKQSSSLAPYGHQSNSLPSSANQSNSLAPSANQSNWQKFDRLFSMRTPLQQGKVEQAPLNPVVRGTGAPQQGPGLPYTSYNKHSLYSHVPPPAVARRGPEPEKNLEMEATTPSHFRTARDELSIQNQKKWGRNADSAAPSYGSSRGTKRSLGTRRPVTNQFVPPVRPDSNDGYGGMANQGREAHGMDYEEFEDERLKNIDPKMIELIRNEIMDCGAPVHWDDIAGLQFAKATIQEIVVWPLLRPEIFTGLRRPPKGILLFGPPGTGKTLIGKCIASQSHSTFFSISASSLTSKWIGEGEKMVRALFTVARCHQPAVIFIDEIDSLLSQRCETEHESSRRIKTEFLVQLDGATTGEEDRILVIGATNRPQELDEAARRRLVKRLYIPLPDLEARCQMVDRLMSRERNSLTKEQICELAALTEGYSGADMKNLCQEASLGPIRSLGFVDITRITPDQVRPIDIEDFKIALRRVRSSVSENDLEAFVAWDKQFGSGGVAFG